MQGRHCMRNVEGTAFIIQQLVIANGTFKLRPDFRIGFRVEPLYVARANLQHAADRDSAVLKLIIQLAVDAASEKTIRAPGQYYNQERECYGLFECEPCTQPAEEH